MNSGLSKKDAGALGNVFREGARKISKVFSALLGKNTVLSFRKVQVLDAAGAAAQLPRKALTVPYTIDGETAYWVISPKLAVLVGELIIGKKGDSLPEEISDQHKEACTQAFIKIIEAESAALAQMLGEKYPFVPGESSVGTPSAKDLSGTKGNFALCEYGLGIEGYFEDTVCALLPGSFAGALSETAAKKVSSKGGEIGTWAPAQLSGTAGSQSIGDLSLLLDTPLKLTVELGKSKMSLKHILELGVGSIVELDKLAGEPVDIKVNNKMLAKGEVVVIDDNFGVRIVNIVKPNERI